MVEEQIQKAKALYVRYGGSILQDKKQIEMIKRYRTAIATTRKTMEDLNMIGACSICSGRWTGGCCFAGVEDWYDAGLLFLNLLLGAELPENRMIEKGCMFVGSSGCELVARHSFCINYLCEGLRSSLPLSDRERFLMVAGDEIFCGIQAEQAVQRWISAVD